MPNLSMRLNAEDRSKLDKLMKITDGNYKTSDIVGAAITMTGKLGLNVAPDEARKDQISFPHLGCAYYLYQACVNHETAKLTRELEFFHPQSEIKVTVRKNTVVKAIPPNILEFGPADKLVFRLRVYPSIRIETMNGQELDNQNIPIGIEKLKICI